jgi:ketosteroid isomerase-like protein
VGSENVETVRRIYESFRTRDNETAFALLDPEIEWDMSEGGIPGLSEVYHGHEGVRGFWRQWLDAWDEIYLDAAEPVELVDGRVSVTVMRQRNRGRGTGIWVDMVPYVQVWTLRAGRAVVMKLHGL